jgi:GNAT superfamily N-acetyltransferase
MTTRARPGPPAPPRLRPASAADAAAVADVYLASRRADVAFAPLAHGEADVRDWIAAVLLPGGGVFVAESGGDVVAMMAVSRDQAAGWIDQLYVAPEWTGRGIGRRLMALARLQLGAPIRLYTFQASGGARRFYEREGFTAVAFGDGSANEEGKPDVRYEWAGAAP